MLFLGAPVAVGLGLFAPTEAAIGGGSVLVALRPVLVTAVVLWTGGHLVALFGWLARRDDAAPSRGQ